MRLAAIVLVLAACGHHHEGGSSGDDDDSQVDASTSGLPDGGGPGSDDGGDGSGAPAGGELDPGFGNGGVVVVSTAGAEYAYDLAVQSDGKIVVAGDAPGGILLLRFLDDGSLDPTFGTQGRVVAVGGYSKARGVAIQPDGKIVVTGNNAQGSTAVVRFDSAGALDPTFGTGGVATPIQNTNGMGIGNDVAVLPDGKILFCGEAFPLSGTVHLGLLGRVTATGALDTSFGTNGYSMLTANRGGWFSRLAVDSQGRIVAAGTVYYEYPSGNGHRFLIGRFDASGAPDPTFANGARLIGAEESYAYDIGVQADDKPISIGVTSSHTGSDGSENVAHRTSLDGTGDESYGTVGTRQWRAGSLWWATGFAMVMQSDGDSVVVGEGERYGSASSIIVEVARLGDTGAIDDTFANNGTLLFEVPGGDAHPRAAALATTGKIYVAGSVQSGSASQVFLAKIQ